MSFRLTISSMALALTLSAPTAFAEGNQSTIPASVAADLLYQIETLQHEVSQLRGQVERQQHELGQMKSLQKDRYLDLDKRVTEAMAQARKSVQAAPQGSTTDADPLSANQSSSATQSVASAPVRSADLDPASEDATQAYDDAYQLIKAKDFDAAQAQFRAFVQAYPNNVLTGNAHYWLGELALVLGNQGEALLQFKTVIDAFSGHAKVSDATYKMGIVNDQMGNEMLARDYFQRTIDNFPDSNAASFSFSSVLISSAKLDYQRQAFSVILRLQTGISELYRVTLLYRLIQTLINPLGMGRSRVMVGRTGFEPVTN